MVSRFPQLTDTEFTEACKGLEQRCHDNLGGTNWLSVRWHKGELQIKQRLSVRHEEKRQLREEDIETNFGELVADVDDTDIISRHTHIDQSHIGIDFSIVVSPTYRVPVLWFTLASAPNARLQDLEDVYARIVPPGSRDALKGIGVMGGISLAHHPITDQPTFFIHPCNTAEALLAVNDGSSLDPFGYLLLWLGIIGSAIGLHVPSRLVL